MKVWFIRFLRKLGILKRLQLKTKLRLNNKVFTIPIQEEVGINNLMMDEWWLLDLVQRLSPKDDDILLDIGANVGQTMLKWKSVNPIAPCYCIEPLTACTKYLTSLIALNEIQKCHVLNYAIAKKSGKAKLNLHFEEKADRTASLHKGAFEVIKQVEIETLDFTQLMNHIEDPSKIKLIKIDAEGAELEILRGMKDFLIEKKVILLVEILSQSKEYVQNINDLLNELSLKIYQVVKRDLMLDHLEAIEEIQYPNHIALSDYVLIQKKSG